MLARPVHLHQAACRACKNFGKPRPRPRASVPTVPAFWHPGILASPRGRAVPACQPVPEFWHTSPWLCASVSIVPEFGHTPSSSRARLPKPGPMTYGEAKAGGPAKPRWCPTDTGLNYRQPPMTLRAGLGFWERPRNGAAPKPRHGCPSKKLCPFFPGRGSPSAVKRVKSVKFVKPRFA